MNGAILPSLKVTRDQRRFRLDQIYAVSEIQELLKDKVCNLNV